MGTISVCCENLKPISLYAVWCMCLMGPMQLRIFSRARLHLIAYAVRQSPNDIMEAPFFSAFYTEPF